MLQQSLNKENQGTSIYNHGVHTTESELVQAVLGPLHLQEKGEDLVVDCLTLGADDHIHWPGHLLKEDRKEDRELYYITHLCFLTGKTTGHLSKEDKELYYT